MQFKVLGSENMRNVLLARYHWQCRPVATCGGSYTGASLERRDLLEEIILSRNCGDHAFSLSQSFTAQLHNTERIVSQPYSHTRRWTTRFSCQNLVRSVFISVI